MKKKSLPKILKDESILSTSEIGNLLYDRSDKKIHRWSFSQPDWFQSSSHKNIGASQKISISWLIIIIFLFLYTFLGLIILGLYFFVNKFFAIKFFFFNL